MVSYRVLREVRTFRKLRGVPDTQARKTRTRGALLRAFSVVGGILLGLSELACQSTPRKPPESPLMQARKDERIQEQQDLEMELQRRHLAPPPAYGNKVVMADTATNRAQF